MSKLQQQLTQRYKPVIFTPFQIRNKIINEDRLGRDIDNFKPKEQIKVLQSYMSVSEIKQRLIHQKEINAKKAKNYLKYLVNSHKSSQLNGGFMFSNLNTVFGGFNKTGLKAYYKFDSFYLPTATVTPSYTSTSGWNQTGTAVTIQTGSNYCQGASVPNNADHRVQRALGVTLSDTIWTIRGKFNISALALGAQAFILWVSAETTKPRDAGDGLGLMPLDSGGGTKLSIAKKDGSTLATSSQFWTFSLSTDYYYQFERQSATLVKFTAFSDSFQTPVSGASTTYTVDSTIQSLDNLQHSSDDAGGAGAAMSFTINQTEVFNSVNPVLKNYATDVSSGDSLGTAADGSLNGVLSIVSGKIDNAYSFDGSTGYSELGTSLSQFNFIHNDTNGLATIAFWMKLAAGNTNEDMIMGTNIYSASSIGFGIRWKTNNVLNFHIANGTDNIIDKSSTNNFIPDTTTWYFYCIRWNKSLGSANVSFRRNDGNEETGNKANTPTNSNAAYALQIGRGGNNANFAAFSIDELSIWNRILTAGEETTLYNSGNGQVIT